MDPTSKEKVLQMLCNLWETADLTEYQDFPGEYGTIGEMFEKIFKYIEETKNQTP